MSSRLSASVVFAVLLGVVLPAFPETVTVRVGDRGDVKTPLSARDAVRMAKTRGATALEVVFEDGVYRFDSPLELTAEDGGTPSIPVVWRAEHRGKAIFTAAVPLVWGTNIASDVGMRLSEAARKHVRVAEVPGSGPLPSFRRGTYLRSGDLPIALFAGNERLPCARWPNEGFAFSGPADHARGIFRFESARLAEWANEPFAWLHGMWGVEWTEDCSPLAFDGERRDAVRLEKASFPFGKLKRGMPFFAFNLFSAIDRPGEWVADLGRRRVYLWPRADLPAPDVVFGEGLVVARGASDVVFDGIVFEKCRRTALRFKDCERMTVRACIVRNTCSWGVDVDGGHDCRVVGCDLYDLGEGGVKLTGGSEKTLEVGNHVAENCHVHHYGQVLHNYREGIALYGTGNRAEHNLIHHSAHTGVFFRGNDHYVGYNVLHDLCQFNDDAGAIYVWQMSWAKRGGVIEHNVIHAIGKKTYPNNTEGIYLDDYSAEVRVEGNLVNRASRGLHAGGGQSHAVQGNVFVNCATPVLLESRMHFPDAKLGRKGRLWIELAEGRNTYGSATWCARYPGLARQYARMDSAGASGDEAYLGSWNVVTGNLAVACGPSKRDDWASISNETVWAGNVDVSGDPGFKDYFGRDWRAAAGSSCREALDRCRFAEAGLYDSRDRISPAVKFGADVSSPKPFGSEVVQGGPPRVNLAVQLVGALPTDVPAFAEQTESCEVPGWSRGNWLFADNWCDPSPDAPWERYAYSFVPACDCSVRLVAMGGSGAKTRYRNISIAGVTARVSAGDGHLFDKSYPLVANNEDRVYSVELNCERGKRVKVTFEARGDGE